MTLSPFALADRVLERLDDLLDRRRMRSRWGELPLALVLLAPALTILAVFGVFPLFRSIAMSLYGGKYGIGPFVGLGNYREALTNEDFWNSFATTAYYALGTIPTTLTLSFIIAYGLFRITRLRGLFRTAYFLPYVTSAVAAAMIWRGLLNPQFGPVNALLAWCHIPAQQWLLEPRGVLHLLTGGWIGVGVGPSLALCCVILFDVWHASGFMIVVFLAGMTTIPRELEEAAIIDGAGTVQLIRRVTIPLLSPTIFFLAVVSGVKSFQAFNSFYALTGNGRGPGNSTQNTVVYLYTNFYEFQRYGYSAAVATLLCVAIIVLTLVQWRFAGRKVHYQ